MEQISRSCGACGQAPVLQDVGCSVDWMYPTCYAWPVHRVVNILLAAVHKSMAF